MQVATTTQIIQPINNGPPSGHTAGNIGIAVVLLGAAFLVIAGGKKR